MAKRDAVALGYARQHLVENLDNRWGSQSMAVSVLMVDAVQSNDPEPALDLLVSKLPALFESPPQIHPQNALQAVDLAHLLILGGQPETAETLLRAVLAFTEQRYVLRGDHNAWRVTVKAQALALLGDSEAALEELRSQVDAGWRILWQWETTLNPNFDSVRDDPAFSAMVNLIEADMRRQLQEVRAMEARGDIPAPPGEAS